jgi:hypothetical protein
MEANQIIKWLRDGGQHQAAEILDRCRLEFKYVDTAFHLWSGEPVDVCDAVIRCPRSIYSEIGGRLNENVAQIEVALRECAEGASEVLRSIRWMGDPDLPNKDGEPSIDNIQAIQLIAKIDRLSELMIAYVTGNREESQPKDYHDQYVDYELLLDELGLMNPNPHRSLESFWEHCKKVKLDTWASRRAYVKDLYSDLSLLAEKAKRSGQVPRNWRKTNENLDGLEPVRNQWAKARRYIYASNPDYENGVKEAINSIESAVRILSGQPNATLGKGVKGMTIDEDIARLMSQAYGLASNRHSVRHGGTGESGLNREEAEFFLEFAAICITYLKQKRGA